MLPTDSDERKTYPLYSGLFAYFPAALAAVAHHSFANNAKHNPGEPLYWNRAKSADEADALLRHLIEGDYVGMAWRALALLQKHLEADGAPLAPGAVEPLHDVSFEADPMLQELIGRCERADDPDPSTSMGINNGTAYLSDHGPNPVSQTTGD